MKHVILLRRIFLPLAHIALFFLIDTRIVAYDERVICAGGWHAPGGMVALPGGDVLVLVNNVDKSTGTTDMRLLKLSARGRLVFNRLLLTGVQFEGVCLLAAEPDNFILIADYLSREGSNRFAKIMTVNANGEMKHTIDYAERGTDIVIKAWVYAGGQLFLAGKKSRGAGSASMFITLVSFSGGSVEERVYQRAEMAEVVSVQVCRDGGLLLAGNQIDSSGNSRWSIAKLTDSGELQNYQLPADTNYSASLSLCPGDADSFLFSGIRRNQTGDSSYLFVRRVTAGGKLSGGYEYPANDLRITSAEHLAQNGFLLCGVTRETENGILNSVLFHFDDNARFLKQIELPSDRSEIIHSVKQLDGRTALAPIAMRSENIARSSLIVRKVWLE